MIVGSHVILYSKDADADRDFVRSVLGFPFVDVGHGWLIFALPPAEVAVHPAEQGDTHELYLMTDDLSALVARLNSKNVECSPVHEERWGSLVRVTLPSGAGLGIYQAKHASPRWVGAPKAKTTKAPKKKAPARRAKPAGRRARKVAKKRR